eukprot:7600996-Pyramimonas_sp.AAC.1
MENQRPLPLGAFWGGARRASPSRAVWGHLGTEARGVLSGSCSWAPLGAVSRPSLAVLGQEGRLGTLVARLGTLLGASWVVLG